MSEQTTNLESAITMAGLVKDEWNRVFGPEAEEPARPPLPAAVTLPDRVIRCAAFAMPAERIEAGAYRCDDITIETAEDLPIDVEFPVTLRHEGGDMSLFDRARVVGHCGNAWTLTVHQAFHKSRRQGIWRTLGPKASRVPPAVKVDL